MQHVVEPAALAALREETAGVVRMRVFSDGGLAPDAPARWGAAVFVAVRGRLRLVAAAAGWAGLQTVPAAELEGHVMAWRLAHSAFHALRPAAAGGLGGTVASGGRALTGAEQGHLEARADFAWGDLAGVRGGAV